MWLIKTTTLYDARRIKSRILHTYDDGRVWVMRLDHFYM